MKNKRLRLEPSVRKEQILQAAVTLSKTNGYREVMREHVAKEAMCSQASVTHYFNTMAQLRRAVMRYAVENEVLQIIAQGLIAKDKTALKAPDTVKIQAVASLLLTT